MQLGALVEAEGQRQRGHEQPGAAGPAEGGGVTGVLFHGRRYDTGNKLDYLRTLVQFACERSDLAEEFVPWLRKYLDSLP